MASQGGSTALILAAERGHKDTVELLLDWGADLHVRTWVSRQGRCLWEGLREGVTGGTRTVMPVGAVSWGAGWLMDGKRGVAPLSCLEGCGH